MPRGGLETFFFMYESTLDTNGASATTGIVVVATLCCAGGTAVLYGSDRMPFGAGRVNLVG